MSQLQCYLDMSTPMISWPSLIWALGRSRRRNNSSKKRTRYSFQEEDDVWWRTRCIAPKWKFRYLAMPSRMRAMNWKVDFTQLITQVSYTAQAKSSVCKPDSLVGPKTPSTVNTFRNAEACLAPSLVRLGYFQPSKEIEKKCNEWLTTSSYFQGTPKVHFNTSRKPPDSTWTLEREYLPIVSVIIIMHACILMLCSWKIYVFPCLIFWKLGWIASHTVHTWAHVLQKASPRFLTHSTISQPKSPKIWTCSGLISIFWTWRSIVRRQKWTCFLKPYHALLSPRVLSLMVSMQPLLWFFDTKMIAGSSGSVSATYECDDNWSDDCSSASSDVSALMDPPPPL